MDIPYFFGAAAGGFVLMATLGIQALVALFSSIPLIRRRKAENPEFNTGRALRRVALVAVITLGLVAVITAVVLHFAPFSVTLGYLLGMILAFICCLKRMSPNNELNRKNFEEAYADCYPPSAVNPDDVPAPASPGPPAARPAPEKDDDVVPAQIPGHHSK